jgi:hypothetical protein
MSDLPTIALEFCQNCLGWESAKKADGRQCIQDLEYIGTGKHRIVSLWYGQLDSVFRLTRDWCRRNRVNWGIYEYRLSPIMPERYETEVRVRHDDWANNTCVRHENTNYAILAACLKAAKHMKEGTQP